MPLIPLLPTIFLIIMCPKIAFANDDHCREVLDRGYFTPNPKLLTNIGGPSHKVEEDIILRLSDYINQYQPVELMSVFPTLGTYRLIHPPTALQIVQIAQQYSGEIGIFRIAGVYFAVISAENSVTPDTFLRWSKGLYEVDIHTHPAGLPNNNLPSLEDLTAIGENPKRMYIVSSNGISRIQKPPEGTLIGNEKFSNLSHSRLNYHYWLVKNGINEKNWPSDAPGQYRLYKQFLEEVYDLTSVTTEQLQLYLQKE